MRPPGARIAPWLFALALATPPVVAAAELLVTELSLNGEARGTALVLEDAGRLFVEVDDARAWRLLVPESEHRVYEGRSFVALEALRAGVQSFDRASLRLTLEAPSAAFEPSQTRVGGIEYRLTPATWGGYAGYDLVANRGRGRSGVDGAFQLAGFSPHGAIDAQFIKRNLWASDGQGGALQRQTTTYRRDWAESLVSFEAGDTYTRAGANTRALRIGGLWAGTNFSLRPGFIAQPLPSFSGDATLPSTVQVFVNNQLRSVTEVPPGPFRLDSVPVIAGAGDARVVVRDALGRESVVSSSFYSTSGLLAPGLSQFSTALGRLRQDGALGEPDYGNTYGAASLRHGMTRGLTLEVSGEFEASRASLFGAAAGIALPLGEMELAAALATARTAGGLPRGRLALGYRYQDWMGGVGVRYERAAHGMVVPGDIDPARAQLSLLTATASRRLTQRLSGGAAWIESETQDGRRLRTVNLSASYALPRQMNLLLSLNRVDDGLAVRHGVSLILSVPLGADIYASASLEGGADPRQSASVQRSPPLGEGYGWRVTAGNEREGRRAEAGVIAQLPATTVQFEAASQSGRDTALRAQAQGSLAWVGGQWRAMRQSYDAFAVVDIPGVADVPVLLNHQLVGRTDADGRLLVPRLISYVPSEIRLDVTGLPPDAEIEPGRDRVIVVPPARSAVRAELGVRRVAAAIVRVLGGDGKPLPAGAAVALEPEGASTSVAGNGEFFVSGTPGPRRAQISSRGQGCSIEFTLASTPAGQAYSQLGPYTCALSPR